MALTATVTKKSVIYVQPKLHNIIFNLVLKEDTTEVFNKDISCQFHSGDSASSKTAFVKSLMQVEIENYKSAKAIYDSTALNDAVTNIQNGLTVWGG